MSAVPVMVTCGRARLLELPHDSGELVTVGVAPGTRIEDVARELRALARYLEEIARGEA